MVVNKIPRIITAAKKSPFIPEPWAQPNQKRSPRKRKVGSTLRMKSQKDLNWKKRKRRNIERQKKGKSSTNEYSRSEPEKICADRRDIYTDEDEALVGFGGALHAAEKLRRQINRRYVRQIHSAVAIHLFPLLLLLLCGSKYRSKSVSLHWRRDRDRERRKQCDQQRGAFIEGFTSRYRPAADPSMSRRLRFAISWSVRVVYPYDNFHPYRQLYWLLLR